MFVFTEWIVPLVLGWCTVFSSNHVVSTEEIASCSPLEDFCYHLLRHTAGLSWYDAYTECQDQGLNLATVSNKASQNVLQGLGNLQDITMMTGAVGVWLGGSRTVNEDDWLDMEGNARVVPASSSASDLCVGYHPDTRQMAAVPCQAAAEYQRVFCQQTPDSSDSCPAGMSLVSNLCFAAPLNYTLTWSAANQFCSLMYPDSTLAYTGIQSKVLKDWLATQQTQDQYNDLAFWVGIKKKPWVWVSGDGYSSEDIMTYSNWGPQAGRSEQGHCAYFTDTYVWQQRPCADTLQYYVCEEVTMVTPDTQPSTGGGGLSKTNIIIIVCVIVGVVLIIIVVVSCLKCRSFGAKRHPEERPVEDANKPYSTDTYASMPSFLESPRDGGQPLEIDPYHSASSVRIKAARDKETGEGHQEDSNQNIPAYDNSGFMFDDKL